MEDPFVTCPYQASHRVPRSRIQNHIVKCQQKYPELVACPYNATHRFKQEDIKKHILDCPSRAAIFPEDNMVKVTTSMNLPKAFFQRDNIPETDPSHEMWDD